VGRFSDVSVVFADCRGFTSLTHERGPELVTALVDEYFRRCSDIIIHLDGILDNFRGDAILAFFNVPIKRKDHVFRAVTAATQMRAAAAEVNERFDEADLLQVGIGVTTGAAYAAIVGSDECRDYTIMGDAVNIASRLQSLATGGEILVTEEVYDVVQRAHAQANKRSVEVKGIKEPIITFSLR
jgi:adenylate cyclase